MASNGGIYPLPHLSLDEGHSWGITLPTLPVHPVPREIQEAVDCQKKKKKREREREYMQPES